MTPESENFQPQPPILPSRPGSLQGVDHDPLGRRGYELRPLTIGEILDRTAQLYRSNFLLFFGISVFPTAVLLAFGLSGLIMAKLVSLGHTAAVAGMVTGAGAAILGGVAYIVLLGVALAATNRAVSDIYLGQPATIRDAYRQVKPHWFRYIWLMFVAALYAWAPTWLLFVIVFGAAGAMKAMNASSSSLAGVIIPLTILAMLIAVPLGIWMTLRYALSVPASIFEDLGIHASLRRSVLLTKHGRGRILVMLLLVVVISMVLAIAVQFPFSLLAGLAGNSSGLTALIALVAGQFGNFAVNALLAPVYGIAITLFYYDARIRKEGFDIEWMMRRANLEPAMQPHPVVNPVNQIDPMEPHLGAGTP